MKHSQYCIMCFREMDEKDAINPEISLFCRACRDLHSNGGINGETEIAKAFSKRRYIAEGHATAMAEAVDKLEAEWLASQQTSAAGTLDGPRRNEHRCELCRTFFDGDYDDLCPKCRADPKQMLFSLLKEAGRGYKPAREIPGYRNIKMLGHGRWSQIWLVVEEASGRQMVLKHMKSSDYMANMKELYQLRFLREMYIAGQLEHPNIVRYHRVGQWEGNHFILMELCEGGSVAGLLRERGGILDLELATRIILQALDGLEYAHNAPVLDKIMTGEVMTAHGIVHRDFKPGNILLCGRNKTLTAKVADFGLAKAFELPRRPLGSPCWLFSGTPKFMSYKHYDSGYGNKPVGDVWAAAATYYYMLTGFFVRPEGSPHESRFDYMRREVVPIRHRSPSIPARLAEVIDHALLDEPQVGVSSASELKRMIVDAL